MKKKLIALFIMLGLSLCLFTVTVFAGGSATGIRFNEPEQIMAPGYSCPLEVYFTPRSYAIPEDYTMTSSDESVVSLTYNSTDGVYTASSLKEGTAVITVTSETGLTSQATITVRQPDGELKLDEPLALTLEPGECGLFTFDFTDDPDPAYEYVILTNEYSGLHVGYHTNWNCDSDVEKCYMQIKGEDLYGQIYVNLSEYAYDAVTFTICVKEQVPVQSAEICLDKYLSAAAGSAGSFSAKNADGYIGDTISLKCAMTPANAAFHHVTWTSSDETVVQIGGYDFLDLEDFDYSHSTYVKCVGVGTATVTATLDNGMTDTYEITVIPKETISLGETSVTLDSGECAVYEFIPEESGYYVLYYSYIYTPGRPNNFTNGNAGLYAFSSYMDKSRLTEDFIGDGRIRVCNASYGYLEAGEMYTISVSNFVSMDNNCNELKVDQFTIPIHLEKAEEKPLSELQIVQSTADNLWIHLDGWNGTSWFEIEYPDLTTVPLDSVNLTWTSSDESILKVTSQYGDDCKIECVSPGTAALTVSDENGNFTSTEVTVYQEREYHIISGQGQIWYTEDGGDVSFEIDGKPEMLKYAYLAGRDLLDSANCTITAGETGDTTRVTLKEEFLKTLQTGYGYFLSVGFIDGNCQEDSVSIYINEGSATQHNHIFGEWKQVKAPSTTEEGLEERTCKCGEKETRSIEKLSTPTEPVVEFMDVKKDQWFYDTVQWAVSEGITNGMTATTFAPDNTCTRNQVVTFLWRAAGQPEPTSSKNPFKDVKTSDYFYKAVLWAVENGITTGTSATTFAPDAPCTRGQVVTFLHRAAGNPAPTSKKNPFSDVGEAYYTQPVLWAVENGITTGITATTFAPESTCTRAQIVTFLYRNETK